MGAKGTEPVQQLGGFRRQTSNYFCWLNQRTVACIGMLVEYNYYIFENLSIHSAFDHVAVCSTTVSLGKPMKAQLGLTGDN